MGNAPSSHPSVGPSEKSFGDNSGDVDTNQDKSSELEKRVASTPDKSNTSGDTSVATSSVIGAGEFNPNIISIQTLGSGSGPTDDAGVYNIDAINQVVGQTLGLGAALGGVAGVGGTIASGDALLSSLPKDLNTSVLGGQLVAIGRLWPGSGRMMRSYRIRTRVPRIDSKRTSPENDNTRSSMTPNSIELACKAFIVRSEEGEKPLRMALTEGDAELKRLRTLLSDPAIHPHVLSYARWIVGQSSSPNSPSPANTPVARPIYLLRQHVHASLSDRLMSRPFLTLIEKNWITYQLLKAVQSLHDAGVCHGHLTTENVLLTSWNWVLISDIGCQHYKPVVLPDDDPGQWIHWFEGRGGEDVRRESLGGHHRGNGEKKCCLAPERFYTPGYSGTKEPDNKEDVEGLDGSTPAIPSQLTPAMDVFSLGCVLIELFLNGERALDLGDLMEYRRKGGDGSTLPQSLKQKLDKIESSKMRAACRHMLSLDPSSRLSPVEYLERLSSNTKKKKSTGSGGDESKNEKSTQQQSSTAPVPPCFKSALYPFMLRLRTQILSPDARIALVACNYGDILKATVGLDDEWGVAFFSRVLGPTLRCFENPPLKADDVKSGLIARNEKKPDEVKDSRTDLSNFSLDELLLETEDLLRQLDSVGFASNVEYTPDEADLKLPKPLAVFDHYPKPPSEGILSPQPFPAQSSIIILLQVVFSSVGHVQRASSKFVALKMMHRIAMFSSDEIRLQRIVPFVTSLLQDPEPIMRASGISVLTSVLAMVTTFPPSDAMIFPRYVFKKVAHLITDASLIVRVAFAENIALLAETALRFLDVGHSVSLYEAVAGRHSRDGSSRDDKAGMAGAIFSEDAAKLLSKQSNTSDDIPASSSNVESQDTTTTTIKSSYDSDLAVLHEVVFRWVIHITTDTSDHSSQSKQALLISLPRLCNFFGAEYSFQILPIILAFLNDRKDWQLRASLCRHLPSVCVAVGRAATEQFVIPCIETALNDDVELVISEALCCLSTLVSMSLLTRVSLLGTEITGTLQLVNENPNRSRRKKQGVIRKCGPLLLHSSRAVRTNAAYLVLKSSQVLGDADAEVFVNQLLRPYLNYKPTFESMAHLSACLKPPLLHMNAIENLRQLDLKDIDAEIEISTKLASSLSVPSQKSVDLVSKNTFNWYEPMHLAASRDSKLTAPFATLGYASLQKVHGLNIELPANSSNHILINQVDEKRLSDLVGNKDEITEDTVASFLNRPEVQVVESACKGEWGSAAVMDQLVPEHSSVHSKIQSLDVPPLSPSLGLARSTDGTGMSMHHWSPKEDNLVGTTSTTEHSGPVNRLAVSEDQSFFVSASNDGTSKVFELRQAYDTGGDIHSCFTYEGHKIGNELPPVRINDVSILKRSHSVATAASDGSLHVWRVDMVSSQQNQQMKRSRVSGHSVLRNINPGEGEVMAVSHFNTSSASILTYATQRGHIHSLDLRSAREPFSLDLRPELGYLTDMEVGSEKNWIVAGTSRGYVGLWDIRFQTMVKLWRHSRDSPIKRLTNGFGSSSDEASRPLLFMGCDNNEAALFDVSTGGCLQCYRVLDSSLSYVDQSALPHDCLTMPYLESVDIPSRFGKRLVSLDKALQMTTGSSSRSGASMSALVGGINLRGTSYLMTGGSDHMIRYWDLNTASKSCCVSGLARNQPPPSFEQIQMGSNSRLILCRQPSTTPASLMESSRLPLRNRHGVVKCDGQHLDSILDIKVVKNPALLLSASRDHTIKLWA